MAELEQLERELLTRHPERWVRHHLASFPPDYFRVFDSAEVSRHLDAMLTLCDDRPVQVRAEHLGGGVWQVDVVGYDAFQFLSTVCTLLAVSGLSIVDGRVFTSQPPPANPALAVPRRASGPKRFTSGGGWWAGPPAQDRRCLSGPPGPPCSRSSPTGTSSRTSCAI